MTHQPTLNNWLSILALGVIWGGTFMVVTIALDGYSPLTVACARTTLGALALLGLVAAMRRPWPAMTGRLMGYLIVIVMCDQVEHFLARLHRLETVVAKHPR